MKHQLVAHPTTIPPGPPFSRKGGEQDTTITPTASHTHLQTNGKEGRVCRMGNRSPPRASHHTGACHPPNRHPPRSPPPTAKGEQRGAIHVPDLIVNHPPIKNLGKKWAWVQSNSVRSTAYPLNPYPRLFPTQRVIVGGEPSTLRMMLAVLLSTAAVGLGDIAAIRRVTEVTSASLSSLKKSDGASNAILYRWSHPFSAQHPSCFPPIHKQQNKHALFFV